MYLFVLSMWRQHKVDEAKVQSYVPKFITQAECDEILSIEQFTETEMQSMKSL